MRLYSMVFGKFIVIFLFTTLLLLAYVFHGYALSITVGLLLAIATAPIYKTLQKLIQSSYKRVFVSFFLTLVLFLFVFLPLIYFVGLSYKYLPKISPDDTIGYLQNTLVYLKNLPEPFAIFQDSLNAFLGEFNIKNIDIEMIRSVLNRLTQFVLKVNGVLYQFFLILFFYFLFNLYGERLFWLVSRLMPMAKRFKRTLFSELSSTLSSVFFGTLFSMLLQGLAFGLFISLFTEYDPFYLGMATGFMTAIPIVGTYIVALPLAVVELLNQNYLLAGVILLFAFVVLSGLIDNYLRLLFMKFLNKRYSLAYSSGELLILLSMIAGVGVFGGWGLIIAPAILALCVGAIKIYKNPNVRKKLLKDR